MLLADPKPKQASRQSAAQPLLCGVIRQSAERKERRFYALRLRANNLRSALRVRNCCTPAV